MSEIEMLRQQSMTRRLITQTRNPLQIDKSTEGEQDWVHSFAASPTDEFVFWRFSYETDQHCGFDFVCGLRVRGLGSAASSHVYQQLERVPQDQHGTLEPL